MFSLDFLSIVHWCSLIISVLDLRASSGFPFWFQNSIFWRQEFKQPKLDRIDEVIFRSPSSRARRNTQEILAFNSLLPTSLQLKSCLHAPDLFCHVKPWAKQTSIQGSVICKKKENKRKKRKITALLKKCKWVGNMWSQRSS